MKNFIFVTQEGETRTPTGENIENLQVLGFGKGADVKDALKDFVENNKYLDNTGFSDVIGIELASDEQFYFSLKNKRH